jgi:ARP2/3 complex 16 kDa subunit (p16-Arc)
MAFRRLNVDQYDEEHTIPPNELVPENPLSDNDLVTAVQSTAQQVRSYLQRGDTQSALAAVLAIQPYGSSPALDQAKVILTSFTPSSFWVEVDGRLNMLGAWWRY